MIIEVHEDLGWLSKVWRREGEPALPYSVTVRFPDGRTAAASLIISDEAVLFHAGQVPIARPSTSEVKSWLQMFLAKPIRKLRDVRLDSLRRWCDVATDDGPCPVCQGQGIRFGENGRARFCRACDDGRLRKPIWGRIGNVVINQRAVVAVLQQLRGESAHFGLLDDNAPILWSTEWMLVTEGADETVDVSAATPFDAAA